MCALPRSAPASPGTDGVMTPDFGKMMQSYGAIDYTVFNG